jgi:hypothetical protein
VKPAHRRVVAMPVLGALLGACGAAGGPDGGGANLPDRGIAPWTIAEEPLALAGLEGLDVRHPTALGETVTGGGVALLVELAGPDGASVARSRREPDGVSFSAPEILLSGGRAPSAARDPSGGLRLVWVEPDGVIATGLLSEPDAENGDPEVVAVDRTGVVGDSPSLLHDPSGRLDVFAVVDGRVVRFDLDAPDGIDEVLAPGEGCVDTAGEAVACWDGSAIVDADVRLARSAAGRDVWRMVYTARSGDTHAFGFAASWDGLRWSRYVWNPVLKPPTGARRPTVIPDGQRYLLFFGRTSGDALGLAVHDSGVASERW